MNLPVLPATKSLKGIRVLLRVDWNVPLSGGAGAEDSLKLSRSVETLKSLKERGAVVLVVTHLGRPKGKDAKLSTKRLKGILSAEYGIDLGHLSAPLDTPKGLEELSRVTSAARPGTVFLLENIRFYAGEEKNDAKFAKSLASLAEIFVNDAFASCHRAHASVVGVAKLLPSYAGPSLVAEVKGLEKLLSKPKHPFIAIVGGAKISTKVDVLKALLKIADVVCVGGAMAHAFYAAKGLQIGKSYIEKEGIAMAKKLLKEKKILLPKDAVVANKIEDGVQARAICIEEMKKTDAIGDIGPETMREWSLLIRKAKTIAWNGPLGVSDIPTFSHGSTVIARAISARSHGSAYGVAGGGDTLPVVLRTGMAEGFDHLSTGGGAMLEFLANGGKLPGLLALQKKK